MFIFIGIHGMVASANCALLAGQGKTCFLVCQVTLREETREESPYTIESWMWQADETNFV
jgi:hypothetical protein